MVKTRIGCKVRSIELSLPQRCAAHILSKTDIDESVTVGKAAVKSAIDGKTGVMMTFVRESDEPYRVSVGTADISGIANAIRIVPDEFINERANGITEAGIRYLAPLTYGEAYPAYEAGLPKHVII